MKSPGLPIEVRISAAWEVWWWCLHVSCCVRCGARCGDICLATSSASACVSARNGGGRSSVWWPDLWPQDPGPAAPILSSRDLSKPEVTAPFTTRSQVWSYGYWQYWHYSFFQQCVIRCSSQWIVQHISTEYWHLQETTRILLVGKR